MTRYRLGFDIGGTFTDLLLTDEDTGRMHVLKLPTTPRDPAQAVLTGLQSLLRDVGITGRDLTFAVHATTLVTNTVIERKGARTALLTTQGFRDVLEIGREKRVTLFDLHEERLSPLVPRAWRREIPERIAFDGSVITPLDVDAARPELQQLLAEGVEAVAICLLHAYANPAHEQALAREAQQLRPDLPVSTSHTILPEWREYERTSTTVINAYTQPKTQYYMRTIEAVLRQQGHANPLFIMQSSGGLMTAATASRFPVRIIESGPAAGALAAAHLGSLLGYPDLMSFDMGGTTAKCCLITDGRPRLTSDFEVAGYLYLKGAGYPVRTPTVDLLEIGAGGGSIAHVEFGLLKVGPQSAGADPGPACYGAGGQAPTVTDADLLLGYLNPAYFLGGKLPLYPELAEQAVTQQIAQPLNLSLVDAAHGIHDVVNANMARAMRLVSVERGRDPQSLVLIAFGGAGPVHAARLAAQLRIRRLIMPLAAGATSAFGLLTADVKFEFSRTYVTHLDHVDVTHVRSLYEEMEAEVRPLLQEAQTGQWRFEHTVDMRYAGQAFELPVPFSDVPRGSDDFAALRTRFEKVYRNYYGYTRPDPAETVTWRLTAIGTVPRPHLESPTAGRTLRDAEKAERPVYFGQEHGFLTCPIYDRYRLPLEASFTGPAVVEERESTAVVPPNARAHVDRYANLQVDLAEVASR